MVQRQKSEPLWKYGAISLTIMISFSRAWLYNKRVKGMRTEEENNEALQRL